MHSVEASKPMMRQIQNGVKNLLRLRHSLGGP